MRGLQDKAAVERVSARVAELTGLDPALVRRLPGASTPSTFQREFRRGTAPSGQRLRYRRASADPNPTRRLVARFEDPVLDAMTAPLTSAILDHLGRTLNYKVEGRYNLLNGAVNGAWRWGQGRGQPESLSELREALALDSEAARPRRPRLHRSRHALLRDPAPSQPAAGFRAGPRASLTVYGGGHMFYSRDASRRAFRDDVQPLYRRGLESQRQRGQARMGHSSEGELPE